MSEVEKQEGQKTVVAFITGLLIGGLLVWVFSSTPADQMAETTDDETTTEVTVDTESTDTNDAVVTTDKGTDTPKVMAVAGNGSLDVADQAAGDSVALGEVKYPSEAGWIVVRDYTNGASGNVLGAARYNLEEGLTPSTVSLLRKTVSGSTYQVGFYNDNGDKAFSLKDDVLVTGGEDTFKTE
jgi:hypothetical protein